MGQTKPLALRLLSEAAGSVLEVNIGKGLSKPGWRMFNACLAASRALALLFALSNPRGRRGGAVDGRQAPAGVKARRDALLQAAEQIAEVLSQALKELEMRYD